MAREESFFDDLARGLADGSISRRRALGLFASSAIAALLPSTRALADDDEDHDGYTVCHVPGTPPNCDCTRARTIRGLSRRERNRHLKNHPCDSRGNCRNNPYCGTTTSTTTTTPTTSTTTTPGCIPSGSFTPCTDDSQCCAFCDLTGDSSGSNSFFCSECRSPRGACTDDSQCCGYSLCQGPNGTCCSRVSNYCSTDADCCPGLICNGSLGCFQP
jgi:hypothetical protein